MTHVDLNGTLALFLSQVKNLSNSYVSVLGSIVTQLGCMTEQRSWCREHVDYDSAQKNSNGGVAGRQQLAL